MLYYYTYIVRTAAITNWDEALWFLIRKVTMIMSSSTKLYIMHFSKDHSTEIATCISVNIRKSFMLVTSSVWGDDHIVWNYAIIVIMNIIKVPHTQCIQVRETSATTREHIVHVLVHNYSSAGAKLVIYRWRQVYKTGGRETGVIII